LVYRKNKTLNYKKINNEDCAYRASDMAFYKDVLKRIQRTFILNNTIHTKITKGKR